jgi:MSHA pilin protein MshC
MSKRMLHFSLRAAAPARSGGFTMVELIVVLILTGILGAIGVGRFFSRTGYDAASFAEEGRTMLRYAQKLAVAQNRRVYVQGSLEGVALCYEVTAKCPPASQVSAPSGANSGRASTRRYCTSSNGFAPLWYCEGWPPGIAMTPVSGSLTEKPFYFDALGRPGFDDNQAFTGIVVTISGDGISSRIAIEQETGYVN